MKKCFRLVWPILWLLMIAWQQWNGEKIEHTETEWLQILGPQRFKVMRQKGMEKAFIGLYAYPREEMGIYECAACHLPLFESIEQYDAGGGYPCFKRPIASKHLYYEEDRTLPLQRYEILCRRCNSHIGHVFHDGPPPKGLRYCAKSLALNFLSIPK